MKEKIDKISIWFLEQSPLTIFLLCIFIGLPLYLWLFSIIYQLDKRRNFNRKKGGILLLYFVSFYPIVYVFLFFLFALILMFSTNPETFFFKIILPFHFLAMICTLIQMIICADSYFKFEESKNLKSQSRFVTFILLAYFIVGVWILQPKLNEYIKVKYN